jgi:hypothetical protein
MTTAMTTKELKDKTKNMFAPWLGAQIAKRDKGFVHVFAQKYGFCEGTVRNWVVGECLPSTPLLMEPLAVALSDWTGEIITPHGIWAQMMGDPHYWDKLDTPRRERTGIL